MTTHHRQPAQALSEYSSRLSVYSFFDSYLGAFAYRFNRRFDLADLVVRLVVDVCRSTATPERLIRHADFHF